MEPVIRAVEVSKAYGSSAAAVRVLSHVSIDVPENRLVALRGRSGSGKTTLLNLLGALDKPTQGQVYFESNEISHLPDTARNEIRRTRLGFVFQSFALVSHMSAKENVELGMRVAGVPKEEWSPRADEALERVGLANRANHRPYEMSGGEQQRCAIARAIAHRPAVLLADEPTAELDSRMAMQIMDAFHGMIRDYHMSILMTTHDPAIMEVADDVYTLQNGEVSKE